MTMIYTKRELRKLLETARSPEQRAALEKSIREIEQLER